MHLVVLIGIIFCAAFTFTCFKESDSGTRKSCVEAGVISAIILIILVIIALHLPDVQPTCTLDGLL